MIPKKIEWHKKSRTLELHYQEIASLILDAEYLRVFSPSAEVRGHSPEQAVLQHGKMNISIKKIEPVGNYAIQLVFDDGHDSGIYSWEYLYELGRNFEKNWQQYLSQLDDAGKSRDPELQTVKLFPPTPQK